MSTRKPSVATQLKNLKIEHAAQQQLLDRTAKERDSEKSSKEYNGRELEKARAELDQMHALLDALPQPILRKPEPSDSCAYPQPFTAATRLSAWLAARSVR